VYPSPRDDCEGDTLYYVFVHELPQKALEHIRRTELLAPGTRIGVAVSGGADSVGLLRILHDLRDEIGIVLSVVHFNHKLRGEESESEERFVAELARALQIEYHVASGQAAAQAAASGTGVEAAARELRYSFFGQLMTQSDEGAPRLDKIATGHTLDDQAETVLMRVVRGSGMRGLAGIYPVFDIEVDDEFVGQIVRPLLGVRHTELVRYLEDIGQTWREDSSNLDAKFMRNRMRHSVIPVLERQFNPAVQQALSELAEIARGEEDYWQNEIAGWMGTAIHWAEPEWAQSGQQGLVQLQPFNAELRERMQQPGPLVMNATVDRMWLLSEPTAVQRRAIKAVGELAGFPLEFKHVEEILRFASDEDSTSKSLSLPLGWSVTWEPAALTFLTPDLRSQERIPSDYEYSLPIPGRAIVSEAGIVMEALRTEVDAEMAGYNPDHLLDPSLLPKELLIRNWRPGDRFWPAHTKSAKKIKELLREHQVTGTVRKTWPVVVSDEEIVWVPGFAVPESHRLKSPGMAVVIRERPLAEE
jgi:tRNA(Ile)-lysidine synthase